jgi:carboxyl-terminal processing protease
MCVTSRPDESFTQTSTAATFVDLLRAGETIEVVSPNGAKRTVTVPAGGLPGKSLRDALACSDPLGRDTSVPVESFVRPDGIAVIRLPGFTDPEQTFPMTGTEADYLAYKEKFEAKIKIAFDKVKTARAIVWDVRGNGGGLTMVGLGIASGFPGATAGEISYCQARVQGSSPPKFDAFRYAEYALEPGGQFAYSGKVAVLTDGMNYSAADYFPLAIKSKTSALLVGSTTAGGFGATSDNKTFDGPPAFQVSIDVNRCSLSSDDSPLEGRGVEPHVVVEYDAKDLAAGKDTVLERAVLEIDK